MTTSEAPTWKKAIQKRLRRSSPQEQDLALRMSLGQEWEDAMSLKVVQANNIGVPYRYKNANVSEGFYYSIDVLSERDEEMSVLFMDLDRTTGKGKRHALAIQDDKIYYLETVPIHEGDEERGPNNWNVIPFAQRVNFLKTEVSKFKDAQIFASQSSLDRWHGHHPNGLAIADTIKSYKSRRLK